MRKSLVASTAEETEQIGARLAAARPADAGLQVVYLTGDLGAGKTTLTRGFLRRAGVDGPVKSPTYTLVETYPIPPTTYVHLDLYRLTEASELENLGLRDWAAPNHVWLIEWPERGEGYLPPPDLVARLSGGDSAHFIELQAQSVLGEAWLGNAGDEAAGKS